MTAIQEPGAGTPIQLLAHSHAGVYVSDMARSVTFYRDVLGFDVRYDSAPGMPGDRVVIGLIAGLAVELVKQGEFDVTPAPVSARANAATSRRNKIPAAARAAQRARLSSRW